MRKAFNKRRLGNYNFIKSVKSNTSTRKIVKPKIRKAYRKWKKYWNILKVNQIVN